MGYESRLFIIKRNESKIGDGIWISGSPINTLELTEDDVLVPFSTADDEGKCSVIDMLEMMRAGILMPYEDEE